MYLKFLIYFPLLLIGKFLAVILSPVIALFTNKDGEIISPFQWAVTHDAPIDSWWKDNYEPEHWLRKKYSQQDYEAKVWVRWYSRMKWILRNPAYGFAHKLGYNQHGMKIITHKDEGHLWDKGYNNLSFYTAVNTAKTKAFMLQWQWFYYKQYCVEVYLGWKLFRNDPDQKCMLSIRISPRRRYEKVPV